MERDFTFTLLLGLLLAVIGCGEDSSLGAGSGSALGSPALDPLSTTPRYAVVSTDFSSSSIAMLDADFIAIDESWFNSGTTFPGLVATLSGDVVLPNRQAGDGTVAVIDRFFTDVVTRFLVPSGNLNGQVRTHGEIGDSGFSSNPQDFIFVDSDSAWVPRFESNLDPAAAPENQGNDLFEINPSDMSATGARIDLSSLDTPVNVGSEDDPAYVEVFARPSRGVLVGSTIVVGLDRISANFDAAGPGMVALVNREDESVEGLELPGMKSCGHTVPVPGAPNKVVVACVGFAQPFGDEPQVRASSGIALLDVGETEVAIEQTWNVAEPSDLPIAVNSVIAIDAQRVVGVASGDFETSNDRLYLIDLTTGFQQLIHESTSSFVIGLPAYDPQREMLYVPDAAQNAVVEFGVDEGGFVEVGSSTIAPGIGLPPTKVYLLD